MTLDEKMAEIEKKRQADPHYYLKEQPVDVAKEVEKVRLFAPPVCKPWRDLDERFPRPMFWPNYDERWDARMKGDK